MSVVDGFVRAVDDWCTLRSRFAPAKIRKGGGGGWSSTVDGRSEGAHAELRKIFRCRRTYVKVSNGFAISHKEGRNNDERSRNDDARNKMAHFHWISSHHVKTNKDRMTSTKY